MRKTIVKLLEKINRFISIRILKLTGRAAIFTTGSKYRIKRFKSTTHLIVYKKKWAGYLEKIKKVITFLRIMCIVIMVEEQSVLALKNEYKLIRIYGKSF